MRPLCLALLILVLPASAAAEPAERGTSTITLGGAKWRAAGAAGVRATLAVTRGKVAATTTLEHDGRVRLRLGERRVTLEGVRVSVARATTISARVGGRRVTLFAAKRKAKVDREALTAAVKDAPLRLTSGGATALRLTGLGTSRVGALTVDADLSVPPVPERPAGAVDVVASAITWHPRESFVQYINSGGGVTVADGATAAGPNDFGFVPAGGWFDPASGRARLTFRGTVRFSYPGHGIRIDAKDPEIEIAGARSRAIFRLGDKRAVLTDLTPGAAVVSGTAHAYDQVPARIPRVAGASVFAGFYLPGDPFGWISVSFTTP